MNSCLYVGQVRHRRFETAGNRFRYPLFMLYLDLDELPRLFRRFRLWSADRPALAWFRRRDHLFTDRPLREELDAIVHGQTGQHLQGPVRLLTQLRYFGYGFNPISLYYCFDRAGETVQLIVAEVHNTPWRNRHVYVLNAGESKIPGRLRFRQPKSFHVSPFMDMNMDYRWALTRPGATLVVHIENLRGERRVFDATLTMKRKPINSANLAWLLIRFPFISLQVIARIYFQALKLWIKRVPYVPHPQTNPVQER